MKRFLFFSETIGKPCLLLGTQTHGRGLLLNLLLRPFDQFRALLRVQTRLAVHPSVAGERHFAVLDLVGDMPPSLARAPGVVMRPIGKVQAGACGVDIAHHGPRNGGDVTVPGPFSFERVAVVAGILQEGGDGWGRRVAGQDVMSGHDGRILVRRISKLQDDGHERTKPAIPFNPLFHGLITAAYCQNLGGLADGIVPMKRFLFFSGTIWQTMPLTKNADV
jgi:hypothetical protein